METRYFNDQTKEEIVDVNWDLYEVTSEKWGEDYIAVFCRKFTTEDLLQMAKARQQEKALEMFAQTLTDKQAVTVSTLYPIWKADTAYKAQDIISYELDSDGMPQLYRVVKDHTPQADWLPSEEESLYTPIRFSSGYPMWRRPTGSHDAYNMGDIVSYNDKLYRSMIDGNTYAPDEYEQGWEEYHEKSI